MGPESLHNGSNIERQSDFFTFLVEVTDSVTFDVESPSELEDHVVSQALHLGTVLESFPQLIFSVDVVAHVFHLVFGLRLVPSFKTANSISFCFFG